LRQIQVRIGGGLRAERVGIHQRSDRAHGARSRRGAGNGFEDVQSGALAQGLKAGEIEESVLLDRPSHRAAELVQPQRGLLRPVEEVARVEPVVTKVLKQRPVQLVRAALGDYANLPSRAGTELGRIVAGLHPELLHVLQA